MQTIEEITADFEYLDDWEDRYRYLIELGRALPPMPGGSQTEESKVRGCVSQVWLASDADTANPPHLTSAGNPTPISFAASSPWRSLCFPARPRRRSSNRCRGDVPRLGLKDHLSPQRSNGLRSMVAGSRTTPVRPSPPPETSRDRGRRPAATLAATRPHASLLHRLIAVPSQPADRRARICGPASADPRRARVGAAAGRARSAARERRARPSASAWRSAPAIAAPARPFPAPSGSSRRRGARRRVPARPPHAASDTRCRASIAESERSRRRRGRRAARRRARRPSAG